MYKPLAFSFHVGSGCQNASAYSKAIEMAHEVFEHGKGLGFKFTVLDIGGGFPGSSSTESLFQEVSTSIKTSLLKYFDNEPGLRVIAEPGRYFAASIHTLAVCVTSKRETVTEQGEKVYNLKIRMDANVLRLFFLCFGRSLCIT